MATPYVLMGDMTGLIPADFLTQALDDDSDGVADSVVWDGIVTRVGLEIDGYLGGRYATPFESPLPSFVRSMAPVLAAYELYRRRGKSDEENPFSGDKKRYAKLLEEIGTGKKSLEVGSAPASAPAVIISEPSKTDSKSKRLAL